jgi:hypothetical protein
MTMALMFNIRLAQSVCKYLIVACQPGAVLVGGLNGTQIPRVEEREYGEDELIVQGIVERGDERPRRWSIHAVLALWWG